MKMLLHFKSRNYASFSLLFSADFSHFWMEDTHKDSESMSAQTSLLFFSSAGIVFVD